LDNGIEIELVGNDMTRGDRVFCGAVSPGFGFKRLNQAVEAF
jgi:hypothetical protein